MNATGFTIETGSFQTARPICTIIQMKIKAAYRFQDGSNGSVSGQ
jgi:hypothetical protein